MTREELTRRILLPNMAAAHRKTGIPLRTLSRRRHQPKGITLEELGLLAGEMSATDIVRVVKAWKG